MGLASPKLRPALVIWMMYMSETTHLHEYFCTKRTIEREIDDAESEEHILYIESLDC